MDMSADALVEMQEPDEARPAKRARLDGSLAVTEDVQDEILDDDDDWDDIYEKPSAVEEVLGTAAPLPGTAEDDVQDVEAEGQELASESLEQPYIADSALGLGSENTDLTAAKTTDVGDGDDGIPAEAIDGGDELVDESIHLPGPDEPSVRMIEETSAVNGAVTAPKATDDAEFMAAAAAQKDNEVAEWQFDSSDAASSSSDSSDDDSDDNSSDSDSSEEAYELLDPATAAKILMSGEGEDDDGAGKKTGADHQPRTANEIKGPVIAKPDVVITDDMDITLLGTVERSVESTILIKGVTPGEYQVLESGSVLCNSAREVIGAVAETLGRVQEPMYSVAFTNSDEIEAAGLKIGTEVYYVDAHSAFVFTQPLKTLKGTDASNIHDEEVGEDEIEFSDDEAEAEYKRLKKMAKKAGRGGFDRSEFARGGFDTSPGSRGGRGGARSFGAPGHDSGATYVGGMGNGGVDAPAQSYGSGMSYDDDGEQETTAAEEFYSPLKRPENLSEMMAGRPPPRQNGGFERDGLGGRGRGDRGRGRGDRGRGDRGRGRGDRGRGRGGAGFNQRGRGDQTNGRGGAGGFRGNAQSFPDRHNNDRGGGYQRQHSLPPKPRVAVEQTSPPPGAFQQQPYSPAVAPQYAPTTPQQYYPPPPPQQQSYQFNGYTFQYGNPPPPPPQYNQPAPTPQTYGYPPQQPAGNNIPPGAFVNPNFFQGQQQPTGYPGAGSSQQYSQPAASAAYSGALPPHQNGNAAQQPPDLAAILRSMRGHAGQ